MQEPISLDIDYEKINNLDYLMQFGREIISAVAQGEISPAAAKTLAAVADGHRRLIENGEMRRMLDEIQEVQKQGR